VQAEGSHVGWSTTANGGAPICPWEGVEGELGLGGDGGCYRTTSEMRDLSPQDRPGDSR
jgi:hypothetical protein